ncbi:MAG: class I adenylate-forming enzyme family protein [Coxiellaceae bacterium]|nr:class I adenylate-forming enzyme family protein [Coxiellaceae bacterium]
MNLAKKLFEAFSRTPNQVIIDEEGSVSFSDCLDRIAQRQQQLTHLSSGAHVFIQTKRGLHYWVDFFACLGLGLVPMPMDADNDRLRIDHLVKLTDPVVFLCQPGFYTSGVTSICEYSDDTYASLICYEADSCHTAAILFTSGTTGAPKGVVLSHRALLGNALSVANILPYQPDDRLFFAIGFQFVSALSHMIVSILSGSNVYATEQKLLKNDLAYLLDSIDITAFGGSPLQLRWLSTPPIENATNLRWCVSSGDHLSKNVIHNIETTYPGVLIYTMYGLTELGGRFCCLPPNELEDFAGSVGAPIPGLSLSILNDQNKPLEAGEIGDIYARGDFLFDGYLKMTDSGLSKHGFKTGDQGFINTEGFLTLCGRNDNIFKSAGKKISTLPITEALQHLSCFADCVVVGIEHQLAGKVPVAFYVPTTEVFHRGKVMRALRSVLSADHLPYEFIKVSQIPRTGSGKPRYAELKAEYLNMTDLSIS